MTSFIEVLWEATKRVIGELRYHEHVCFTACQRNKSSANTLIFYVTILQFLVPMIMIIMIFQDRSNITANH